MESSKILVTDLGSTNGTFVDGKELPANEEVSKCDGNVAEIDCTDPCCLPNLTAQADRLG